MTARSEVMLPSCMKKGRRATLRKVGVLNAPRSSTLPVTAPRPKSRWLAGLVGAGINFGVRVRFIDAVSLHAYMSEITGTDGGNVSVAPSGNLTLTPFLPHWS